MKAVLTKMLGNFTWRDPVALDWLAVAFLVSCGTVVGVPEAYIWICGGGLLVNIGWGVNGLRTGRTYLYFADWNWIESVIALTGSALASGACIGVVVASFIDG
jgi:hypothetical protein